MDNKSLILRQKKLRLEYRFLIAELEEIEHIIDETDKELKKIFKDDLKKVSKQTEIINKKQENKKDVKVKTGETKKIYRKIVEVTHPDKVGNNSFEDIFKQAVNAHKSGDIFTLYNIADDLGIKVPEISEGKILLMEKKNKDLSNTVSEKKKSFGWKWYNASSEEEKENLKKSFYHFHGINKINKEG